MATFPPIAQVCALHGPHLEATCVPCKQGCPPLEATTRCTCPSLACMEPGSAGCHVGEAAR